ncbi:hypothetical protein SAMN05421730_1009115 [Anaerobium acetethylicum]|uniref:Uncharacterized protein n=1 Tax=Anaerobium acetethylicum TaxID=1619234 RepID=A0A1D3TTL8_9FIRM|nr:hypothetical protein SAMN05421730_1009115 [Anaerobium acetethylicum]
MTSKKNMPLKRLLVSARVSQAKLYVQPLWLVSNKLKSVYSYKYYEKSENML